MSGNGDEKSPFQSEALKDVKAELFSLIRTFVVRTDPLMVHDVLVAAHSVDVMEGGVLVFRNYESVPLPDGKVVLTGRICRAFNRDSWVSVEEIPTAPGNALPS